MAITEEEVTKCTIVEEVVIRCMEVEEIICAIEEMYAEVAKGIGTAPLAPRQGVNHLHLWTIRGTLLMLIEGCFKTTQAIYLRKSGRL